MNNTVPPVENILSEASIPVENLIVFKGEVCKVPVRILKDDGCNTNIISSTFVLKHASKLEIQPANISIFHSKRQSSELSDKVVLDATVKIGDHNYKSNFVVADCRYDVLLGMPWHKSEGPTVDYRESKVEATGCSLPIATAMRDGISISNLGINKFRKMIKERGKSETLQAFAIIETSNAQTNESQEEDNDSQLLGLLDKYKGIFREELPSGLPPRRNVDHSIETFGNGTPPRRGLYQLSPAELNSVKEYISDLLQKKKIRRSRSPYGASLFFVKNKEKLRAVVDYRALNRITKRNNSPIPRPDEMFDRLGEATVFSKLDLKTGFHQIRMRPEDIEKTAFNTKYGQFEYLVMPMGLCNAPATFQTLMNQIFSEYIDDFIVVYMDDLLVFSQSREEHLKHLELVLEKLQSGSLYVSPKKCSFMKEETEFLGMIVGREGIKVDPDKIRVIQEWPIPTCITDVRSFVGLLQFFRRFIQNFSALASPLTSLTKKGRGIKDWNSDCENAFNKLKSSLVSAPILMPADWKLPFRCHVDASQFAVGGTLTQIDSKGSERVVAYFSKKLSDAEQNYTANERELLGLVFFLKRFRCYLEGSEFEVITDNQVLHNFFTKQDMSRKEARWLDLLSQFNISRISLKAGKVHVLGDVLSRAPQVVKDARYLTNNMMASSANLNLEFENDYTNDQMFGPILKGLRKEFEGNPIQQERVRRLLPMFEERDRLLLYDQKICVPRTRVADIMELAHDISIAGHFGFSKTLGRLNQYHWKNKTRDVRRYCDGCTVCQQNKDSNQKKLTNPTSLRVPTRRWGSVSTDFIVSLPKTKQGHNAITTWVDRISRRVHFIPCTGEDTAIETANNFFKHIFTLHGLPDEIISDRDPKFVSKFWTRLMQLCGIKKAMSTSNHPQTDGSSEIMNRVLENYIRCYCSLQHETWDEFLHSAEFSYNSAISDDLGMTPFEVDLGYNPKSPIDLLKKSDDTVESINEFRNRIKSTFEDAQFCHVLAKARQSANASVKYQTPNYTVGDQVWLKKSLFRDSIARSQVSNKLSPRCYGPFNILELIGKNALRLELPSNIRIHPVVHVEHTKPYIPADSIIGNQSELKLTPVLGEGDEQEYEVERILAHRSRGKGLQFLTLLKNSPRHEAEWQPSRDFIDSDGTLTNKFRDYIVENSLLPHLY